MAKHLAKHLANVKTISRYRAEQDGNTTVEVPVADEESKTIIEVNFKQYVDVLSDILMKYVSNFKAGQAGGKGLCLLPANKCCLTAIAWLLPVDKNTY